MSTIKSFRDLLVWQKAMDLAELIYRLAKHMPRTEEYRLTGQLLRAAASVPANIAEGHMRGTRKDYAHFVTIARGSLAELETQVLMAERLGYVPKTELTQLLTRTDELGKMLRGLQKSLKLRRERGGGN